VLEILGRAVKREAVDLDSQLGLRKGHVDLIAGNGIIRSPPSDACGPKQPDK
jgi:hypothetical protein